MATLTQRISELTDVLTDQAGHLAKLTEQVRVLTAERFIADELVELGRNLERRERFSQAAQACRPRRTRPSHLRSVGDNAS
jgi:uncharacterized coiled-coil protein SlyX